MSKEFYLKINEERAKEYEQQYRGKPYSPRSMLILMVECIEILPKEIADEGKVEVIL